MGFAKDVVKSWRSIIRKRYRIFQNPNAGEWRNMAAGIEEIENRLRNERKRVSDLIASLEEEGVEPEGPDHSDHLAEYASYLSQREYTAGEILSLRHILAEIDHALQKIATRPEKAGSCEKCGMPIEEGRLIAKPWARYCLDCRTKYEKSLAKRK
jgi:DnaK suppressor protein